MYIHKYKYIYIYVYIDIDIDREREIEINIYIWDNFELLYLIQIRQKYAMEGHRGQALKSMKFFEI